MMPSRRCAPLYALIMLSAALTTAATSTCAETWRPAQHIELVVPTSAGSGSDGHAREIERYLREKVLVERPVSVVNKPGGGGAIGLVYLNQRAGDGHLLMVTGPTLLTNHITGRNTTGPKDVTPLALLGSESVVFAVRADSRLNNARELGDILRRDPASVSIALANALGNNQHIATGMVVKAVGGNVRALKVVVFNSSAEIITALLGGHVDAIATSAATALPHHKTGKVRVLAVLAEQRLANAFPDAPTWAELGVSGMAPNFRIVVGPRALAHEQVQYWDQVFGRLVKLDEWKRYLAARLVEDAYADSKQTKDFIERQYAELRTVLSELGLVKGKPSADTEGTIR